MRVSEDYAVIIILNRRESETYNHMTLRIYTEAKPRPQDHNTRRTVMDTSNINISMNHLGVCMMVSSLSYVLYTSYRRTLRKFRFIFSFFVSSSRTCRFHELLTRFYFFIYFLVISRRFYPKRLTNKKK